MYRIVRHDNYGGVEYRCDSFGTMSGDISRSKIYGSKSNCQHIIDTDENAKGCVIEETEAARLMMNTVNQMSAI